MESQPQNPEFRHNPENFHQCMIYLNFSSKVLIAYAQKPSLNVHAHQTDKAPILENKSSTIYQVKKHYS